MAAAVTSLSRNIVSNSQNSLTCSCTECDSMICQVRRKAKECKCELNTKNDKKQETFDELAAIYLKAARSVNLEKKKSNQFEEIQLNKNDQNFEEIRKEIFEKNIPTPPTLDEYVRKLLEKTYKHKVEPKKTLSDYINAISGEGSRKKQIVIDNYIKEMKESRSASCKSLPIQKDNELKKRSQVICIPHIITIDNSTQCDTIPNNQLSCQSYVPNSEKLKGSVHSNSAKPTKSVSMCVNNSTVVNDIFKMLKDIYKVCNCKVCECIPSTSVNKCDCKPCECSKCLCTRNKIKKSKLEYQKQIAKLPLRIPDIIEVKTKEKCFCKPCNCPKCARNNHQTPCHDDACSCINLPPKNKDDKNPFYTYNQIYNFEFNNQRKRVKNSKISWHPENKSELSSLINNTTTSKLNGNDNASECSSLINTNSKYCNKEIKEVSKEYQYDVKEVNNNEYLSSLQDAYSELSYYLQDYESKQNNKLIEGSFIKDNLIFQNKSNFNSWSKPVSSCENNSLTKKVNQSIDKTNNLTIKDSEVFHIPKVCISGPNSSIIRKTEVKKSRSPERSLILNQKRNQNTPHLNQYNEAFTAVIGDGTNKPFTLKSESTKHKLNQKIDKGPKQTILNKTGSSVLLRPLTRNINTKNKSFEDLLKNEDNELKEIQYQEGTVLILPKISTINHFENTCYKTSKYSSSNHGQKLKTHFTPIYFSKTTTTCSIYDKKNKEINTDEEYANECSIGFPNQYVANAEIKSNFNGRLISRFSDNSSQIFNNDYAMTLTNNNSEEEKTKCKMNNSNYILNKHNQDDIYSPSIRYVKSASQCKIQNNRFTKCNNNMLCLHKHCRTLNSNSNNKEVSGGKDFNSSTIINNGLGSPSKKKKEIKSCMCKKTNDCNRQTKKPLSQKTLSFQCADCNSISCDKNHKSQIIYTTQADLLNSNAYSRSTKSFKLNTNSVSSGNDSVTSPLCENTNKTEQSSVMLFPLNNIIIARTDKSTKTSKTYCPQDATEIGPKESREECQMENNEYDIYDDKKEIDKDPGPRCRCSVCRCERCFGDEFINPVPKTVGGHYIRKGDILTPETHWAKIRNLIQARSQIFTNQTIPAKPFANRVIQESNDTLKPFDSISIYKARKTKTDTATEPLKLIYDFNANNCDAFVQCELWIHQNGYQKNEAVPEVHINNSSLILCDESVSKCKVCEREKDRNLLTYNSNMNLGLNFSGYLIQVPKSTTKACLKNLLKLNFENDTLNNSENNPINVSNKEDCMQSKDNLVHVLSYLSIPSESERSIIKKTSFLPNTFITESGTFYVDSKLHKCTHKSQSLKKMKTDNVKSVENNTSSVINTRKSNCLNIKHSHLAKDNQDHCSESVHSSFNLTKSQSPECEIPKQSAHTPLQKDNNSSPSCLSTCDEYNRVNKTLNEAKIFYLHVIQLIDKYDNAIHEFDKERSSEASIIRKINCFNQELSNIDLLESPLSSTTLSKISTHLVDLSTRAKNLMDTIIFNRTCTNSQNENIVSREHSNTQTVNRENEEHGKLQSSLTDKINTQIIQLNCQVTAIESKGKGISRKLKISDNQNV